MERRSLVNKFFEENGLVEHHISSYNSFIENGLQSVIDEIGVINPDIEGFEVRLDGIRVGKPSIKEATGAVRQIFPNEARLRDLTYASPLILELTPIQNEVEQPKMEVPIGSLPTMLRSKICNLYGMDRDELIGVNEDPNDPGGYFVVNGTERVLILVEDLAPNLMNVSHVKLGPTTESARVFSEGGWYRRRNSVSRKKDGGLIMEMPPFSKPVPFIAVLKALGMEKDSDIVKEIASNPSLASELYVSFEEAEEAKKIEAEKKKAEEEAKKIAEAPKEETPTKIEEPKIEEATPNKEPTEQPKEETANPDKEPTEQPKEEKEE